MSEGATKQTALIPQPFLPMGEGEQDFKVPLPRGEGFRVRADQVDILPKFKAQKIAQKLQLLL